MTMELDTILCGDSLNVLKALPESSVHCCVTSPPYYGLRVYGGQLLRHRQQGRCPRPQISAGAQRAEYFPLPSGTGLQAKGHDRDSVDAGLCAPRRRLVSAQ